MWSNQTSSSSSSVPVDCFTRQLSYFSMLIALSVLICLINLAVLYILLATDSLRTTRNAFLGSLAISDLLTGTTTIPLHIACSCYRGDMGNLCLAQALCFRLVAISTMLNIFMITVERYIGIIYPLRYTVILTKPRLCVLLMCTWGTSVTVAMVPYSWLAASNLGGQMSSRTERWERAYFIFFFAAFFLLPLTVMIVLYTRMFLAISRARRSASQAHVYLKKMPGGGRSQRVHAASCGGNKLTVPDEPVGKPRSKSMQATESCPGHVDKSTQSLSRVVLEGRSLSTEVVPAITTSHHAFAARPPPAVGMGSGVSLGRRFSDACSSAASKLRMLKPGGSHEGVRMVGERRVLVIFVAMISFYAFFWLSWYILLFDYTLSVGLPNAAISAFNILRFALSFFNPILYTFLKNDFRAAFAKTCIRRRRPRDGEQSKRLQPDSRKRSKS